MGAVLEHDAAAIDELKPVLERAELTRMAARQAVLRHERELHGVAALAV